MKKIIIVDDNRDIVEVMTLMLEIEGYDVLGLVNPEEVIDEVRNFVPNLIILDVMLGEIDGRDICHHLKTSSDTKAIPIMMFSAVHNLKSILENRCDADDFISKPFNVEIILSKIVTLIAA
jgi:DNA-binding response OmpR family regulator